MRIFVFEPNGANALEGENLTGRTWNDFIGKLRAAGEERVPRCAERNRFLSFLSANATLRPEHFLLPYSVHARFGSIDIREGVCAAVSSWMGCVVAMNPRLTPEGLRAYVEHRNRQWSSVTTRQTSPVDDRRLKVASSILQQIFAVPGDGNWYISATAPDDTGTILRRPTCAQSAHHHIVDAHSETSAARAKSLTRFSCTKTSKDVRAIMRALAQIRPVTSKHKLRLLLSRLFQDHPFLSNWCEIQVVLFMQYADELVVRKTRGEPRRIQFCEGNFAKTASGIVPRMPLPVSSCKRLRQKTNGDAGDLTWYDDKTDFWIASKRFDTGEEEFLFRHGDRVLRFSEMISPLRSGPFATQLAAPVWARFEPVAHVPYSEMSAEEQARVRNEHANARFSSRTMCLYR